MKNLIGLAFGIIFFQVGFTQEPQFAIVRPDGTTYIFTNLDSAYHKAQNGDNLLLPNGSFAFSNPIDKSIFIKGVGYTLGPSPITGQTVISGLNLKSGASGGSISGCNLKVYCYSGCPATINIQGKVNSYRITNCFINSGINFDSLSSNFIISQNIIGYFGQGCLYGGSFSIKLLGQNHLIANNLILGVVTSAGGNKYSNNIFTYCQQYCYSSIGCNNELFENNIFNCASNGVSNSIFKNNIGRSNGIDGQNNQGYNNYGINDPIDSLFISYSISFNNDGLWSGNFHLKPNSPYLVGGTNGTEIGIYGGLFPWDDSGQYSTPVIYYKKVGPNSTSDGKLKVEYKVRAGN